MRKSANREVVGLFVAPSLLKLASLVDECCDPAHCEYAFAGTGGLMVPEASAATWPRAAGESATGLEDAVYSQQWEPDLGPDSTLRWKSLAPATHGLLKALARTPSQAASTDSPADDPAFSPAGD